MQVVKLLGRCLLQVTYECDSDTIILFLLNYSSYLSKISDFFHICARVNMYSLLTILKNALKKVLG